MSKKKVEVQKWERPNNVETAVVPGSAYATLLKDIFTLSKSFYNKAIEFYWHLGKHLEDLVNDPEKYGKHSVEMFAKDLETTAHLSLGTDSLYSAQKIHKYFTKTQLELAKDSNMSLRQMVKMTPRGVTPEMREQLLLDAKNHTGPTVFDVEAAVATKLGAATGGKANKTTKTQDDTELKKSLKRVKGAERMVQMLETKLSNIGDCFAHICSEDDAAAMCKAYEYYKDFKDAITSFTGTMGEQLQKATRAFDKVKSIVEKK